MPVSYCARLARRPALLSLRRTGAELIGYPDQGLAPIKPLLTRVTLNGGQRLGPVANFYDDNNAILGALAWTATFDDNVNSVITWLTGNGFAATSIGGGQFEVSSTHFFNDKEYVGDGPNTNDPNSIAINREYAKTTRTVFGTERPRKPRRSSGDWKICDDT